MFFRLGLNPLLLHLGANLDFRSLVVTGGEPQRGRRRPLVCLKNYEFIKKGFTFSC